LLLSLQQLVQPQVEWFTFPSTMRGIDPAFLCQVGSSPELGVQPFHSWFCSHKPGALYLGLVICGSTTMSLFLLVMQEYLL